MTETNAREEQLLRMVGEERAEHPPELVAAAEHELARRAGGTRRLALRRIRNRAMVLVLSGLYLLTLAASSAVGSLRMDNPLGRLAAFVGVALGGVLGLALAALGLGLIPRNRWVARNARHLPFACAQEIEVTAYDPDTASLLDLIGSDRQATPPDSAAGADREIRRRLALGREATRSRVRSWGKVCIPFGVLALAQVIAMGGLGILVVNGISAKTRGSLYGAPGANLLALSVFFFGFLVGTAGSALIVLAGLKLRRTKRGACRDLVWGMWAWLAGWLAFPLVVPLTLFLEDKVRRSQDLAEVAVPLLALALWATTCGLAFWRATRALCRPEVKEACGVETPVPEGLR